MAHVYRLRIDAEGQSAAEVDRVLKDWHVRILTAAGLPVLAVGEVIEMGGRPDWFTGRLNLAPDLAAQGYDTEHGAASLPEVRP